MKRESGRRKTNPIGKNSKNLSVNVPKDLYERLAKLAAKKGTKGIGEYVRGVLMNAADQGIRVEYRLLYTLDPDGQKTWLSSGDVEKLANLLTSEELNGQK